MLQSKKMAITPTIDAQTVKSTAEDYPVDLKECIYKSINHYFQKIDQINSEFLHDEKGRVENLMSATLIYNDNLKRHNRQWRILLGKSPDYKRECLYVLSFKHIGLQQMIKKNMHFKIRHSSKQWDHYTKIKYTFKKFSEILQYAVMLLFAKYRRVYDFQLDVTFVKILIDYFDASTIDYNSVNTLYNQFKNWDMRLIRGLMVDEKLCSEPKEIHPDVTKKPRKRDCKITLSVQEYVQLFRRWKKTGTVEKKVAKKFQCSERTVRRDMIRKNVKTALAVSRLVEENKLKDEIWKIDF